jgi:DNA-directed RNA polymerase specialized sigma24 family protein
MQELEQMHSQAASLYRLAWLLTGEREISVDATLETLDTETDPDSSFAEWMLAWSRRVVIAKVLTVIRGELAASARRTASIRLRNTVLPPGSANLGDQTTSVQLDRALLGIDLFPRCALVLTVFEGISVEDAAVLLDGSVDLVRKARTLGLKQLVDNLARMQVRTSVAYQPFVMTTGVQHA